jgi:AhpD family alkylhydroperoxidase
MSEQKQRSDRFTEALGEGIDTAFKKLASEILREGALSAKDKALIALACSVAVKCEYCVERHKGAALKAGASREEMLEAAAVAGLVRMGSGFNTASFLLDDSESN